MEYTHYIKFAALKTSSKYIHTKNSSLEPGTNLVIRNGSGVNYDFLCVPVSMTETGFTDWWYIFHTQSGLPVGVANASQQAGANIQISDWTGGTEQQWKFVEANGESGEDSYCIVNRNSGLGWKLDKKNTDNGTRIEQHIYELDNKAYMFGLENQESIPNPDLVQVSYNTGVELNDSSTIPVLDSTNTSQVQDTPAVLIGEAATPFYMVNDPTLSNFASQLRESPYYLAQRSQYWSPFEPRVYPAGTTSEYTEELFYGVTESQFNTWTSITDWSISASLAVGYGPVSLGVSASYGQSMEISQGSETSSSEEFFQSITISFPELQSETLFADYQLHNTINFYPGTVVTVTSEDENGTVTYVAELNENATAAYAFDFENDTSVLKTYPEIVAEESTVDESVPVEVGEDAAERKLNRNALGRKRLAQLGN